MKTKLLHIICLMALLALHSCSHDDFDKGKDKSNLSIDEARSYFENNATDLRYNELVYSYTPTKADDNVVPLWDKAKQGTTPNSEVVMVPILEAGKIKALITSTLFGRKDGTTDNVKVESHLVIQRYNTSGKMRRFITTVVGISDVRRPIHIYSRETEPSSKALCSYRMKPANAGMCFTIWVAGDSRCRLATTL